MWREVKTNGLKKVTKKTKIYEIKNEKVRGKDRTNHVRNA